MRVVIFSYWKNRWVYYMQDYFKQFGDEVIYSPKVDFDLIKQCDVCWLAWANEMAVEITNHEKLCKKYVVYIRGYEVFGDYLSKINWENVDNAIFTNDAYVDLAKRQGMKMADNKIHWSPNGIDLNLWKFQEGHTKGTKIAFLANINHKKGLPLLWQIMAVLPKEYTLYLAGGIQDLRFWFYIEHLSKENPTWGSRIRYDGFLKNAGQVMKWMSDKDYIISTSPTEGCPNCLLEGMAVGLKPVIHNWAGAKKMFPNELVFNTIEEAKNIIIEDKYDSLSYRKLIEDRYDVNKIYPQLKEIICS